MMPITAQPASRLPDPAPIRSPLSTHRADGNPARGSLLNRKTMADTHLESGLRGINRLHLGPKARAMTLSLTQHKIHPGVDHFVAERAFRSDLRKRFQHGSRQNDLAAAALAHPRATAVKPRGAAHPPIAPAHRRQRLAPIHQSTAKMLSIETVKQRQQGLQRHRTGGGDPNQRHPAVVSQTRPCFDSW